MKDQAVEEFISKLIMQNLSSDEQAQISTTSLASLFTIEDAFIKLDNNNDGEVDSDEVQ